MTVLWGEGSGFGPVRVLQGQHSHGKRLWGEQLLLTAEWHRGHCHPQGPRAPSYLPTVGMWLAPHWLFWQE